MLLEIDEIKATGVIHVGAHHGQEIAEYIEMGSSRVILFEPLMNNFRVLNNNVLNFQSTHPEVKINSYNVALGNSSNSSVKMNLSTNDLMSSSILTPKDHLTRHPEVGFGGEEFVLMNKLDDYVDQCFGCNFLAIDTQGYELEVLRGGTEVLNSIDYVYCEVNRAEVYEGNAFVEEIDDFLLNYSMTRIATNWAGGIWGDALYQKNK